MIMVPDPDCCYRLAVKHSGKFLTVDENKIVQNERNDSGNQIWKFISAGEGYYYFLATDEKILAKKQEPQGEKYFQLELSEKPEGNNQKWKFIKTEDDEYYLIRSKVIEYHDFLDVAGAKIENGREVILYKEKQNKNKIDNQKWKLESVSSSSPPLPSLSSIIHMKHLLESFKNLVFQSPPGTSKTYNEKLLAASVMLGEDDDENLKRIIQEEGNLKQDKFSEARFPKKGPKGSWSIVQFHPAYSYEDFVRGIEVKGNGATVSYNAVRRIFDRMAQTAWKAYREDAENYPKYVLIIDEINRVHLAAVLGELIYALEYRGAPVDSPYAVEECTPIIVPPNLYIIGTMNTADRSIGHIDYAVRRRFAFVPLLPEEEPINSESGKKLFREIAELFKDKNGGRARTLSPEFHADDVQPGHIYFITCSSEVIDELSNKFAYQVYPLLREYLKDGILINSPGLFGGKLRLDTPCPPQKVLEILKSFLNGS